MPKKYPDIHAINNYCNTDIKALMIKVDPYNKELFKVIRVIKDESLKT